MSSFVIQSVIHILILGCKFYIFVFYCTLLNTLFWRRGPYVSPNSQRDPWHKMCYGPSRFRIPLVKLKGLQYAHHIYSERVILEYWKKFSLENSVEENLLKDRGWDGKTSGGTLFWWWVLVDRGGYQTTRTSGDEGMSQATYGSIDRNTVFFWHAVSRNFTSTVKHTICRTHY